MLVCLLPALLLVAPAFASPAPAPAPAPEPTPAPVLPRAGSPSPWVTVNNIGESPTTISPTVSGTNTVSAPPSSLTKTSSWILTVTGVTTTSTGLPPVATLDGKAFLTCSNYQGHVAPFCQPASGVQLDPDNDYFITWDTTYFQTDTQVTINGDCLNCETFSFAAESSDLGYTVWTPGTLDDYSDGKTKVDQANITFYMTFQDGNETIRLDGPNILLTNKAGHSGGVGGNGHHKKLVLSIVLPIVLVLAAAALCGFCFWSYRRHGFLPFFGKVGKSTGYGERQAYAERTGNGVKAMPDNVSSPKESPSNDIQLTDQSGRSPSTSRGNNVFREELQRQAEERR